MEKITPCIIGALSLAMALGGCSAGVGGSQAGSTQAESTKTGSVADNTGKADSEQKASDTKINVGELVTVKDRYEFQLDSSEWADEVLPSDTSSFYTYQEKQEGKSYFIVKGTLKNIGPTKSNLGGGSAVGLGASFKFNDKYTIDATTCVDGGTTLDSEIDPLDSKTFIIYGSVSNEIKDSFKSCDVTLTVHQEELVDNVWNYDRDGKQPATYTATFK